MYERSSLEDLRRMYELLGRVDAQNQYLRQSLYEFVKATGEKIVSDESNLKVRVCLMIMFFFTAPRV